MKVLLRTVAASLLALVLFFPAFGSIANAYVNDDDVNLIEAALSGINTYSTALGSSTGSVSQAVQDGSDAQTKLESLTNHSFVTGLGTDYSNDAIALKNDAGAISTDIGNIDAALQGSQTETQINSLIDTFNTDINKFNDDQTSLNNSVSQHNVVAVKQARPETIGYLVLLIATVIVTIGSFIWARRRPGELENMSKERRGVAVASIFPLIGAAITYGTFLFASRNGGTYFIAWGPIAIGGFAYVRTLTAYLQMRKKYASLPPNPVATPYPQPVQSVYQTPQPQQPVNYVPPVQPTVEIPSAMQPPVPPQPSPNPQPPYDQPPQSPVQ